MSTATAPNAAIKPAANATKSFLLLPKDPIGKELVRAAHKFTQAHEAWVNNHKRPVVDEQYFDAAHEIIGMYDALENVPDECVELRDAVDQFHQEFVSYNERPDEQIADQPNEYFWAAREAIETALLKFRQEEPMFPPLESIKELASQGTPHEQIARIYRLIDDYGRPKTYLIQRELDMPGSVIKPGEFVDPRIVDWYKERGLTVNGKQIAADSIIPADSVPSNPNKETPFQLWEQKVGTEQAALMLQMPQPDVAELYAKYDAAKKDFEDGKIASYVPAEEQDAAPQTIAEVNIAATKAAAATELLASAAAAEDAPPSDLGPGTATEPPGTPEETAKFLLEQGETTSEVVKKTGLKASEVAKIAKTVIAK